MELYNGMSLEEAEQFVRFDHFTAPDGMELYASFTMEADELVQISEWMPIEQAWEEYQVLVDEIAFPENEDEVVVQPVRRLWSLLSVIAAIF